MPAVQDAQLCLTSGMYSERTKALEQPEFARGDRIQVVKCTDPNDPIPAGATGSVRSFNSHPAMRQLDVNWDPPHDHRHLMLILIDNEDEVVKL